MDVGCERHVLFRKMYDDASDGHCAKEVCHQWEAKTFVPRDYDVFAELDVDKRSISVTFTDHQGLSPLDTCAVSCRASVELRGPALCGTKSRLCL